MTKEKMMEVFKDGKWVEISMRDMKEGDRVRDPDLSLPIEFTVRKRKQEDGVPEMNLDISVVKTDCKFSV